MDQSNFLESLAEFNKDSALAAEQAFNEAFPNVEITTLDPKALLRLAEAIEQMDKTKIASGMDKWFTGEFSIDKLPKHKAFFEATAKYSEVCFLAGNRVGKSLAGAYMMACHLTGIYPTWWTGRKFDEPVKAWAIGKTARDVRDTMQQELLGPIGEWGTGMIPAHLIGKFYALQGTPQAIDIIKVKHVPTGKWSELGFKNYQQDIGSFMGTSRHVIWGDEEMPMAIYNECNIRTATVNGIIYLTFTPLDGLTPLVINICKNADYLVGTKPIVAMDQEDDIDNQGEQAVGFGKTKAVIQAGWDDATWLDAKTKARLLEDTPEHLREARSKGYPAQGSGNVYQTPIEQITVAPFNIPGNWPRMYALDVGWNRTAAEWAALDPATDTLYVYSEHYLGKELPPVHAYAIRNRGEWIPGVIDPAAHGRSQIDGKKLIETYKDLGLDIREANNEVESGILNVQQRLAAGTLKIFSTCTNILKEYQLYRRDTNGKIIKENDHALDCLRYIVNNMKRMESSPKNLTTESTYVPTRYNV